MGYRPDNPASDALGRQQAVVQHMRALPHGAVADALATVRASSARPVVKLIFEFVVLTAARSGEVRLATLDEMDQECHRSTQSQKNQPNTYRRAPVGRRSPQEQPQPRRPETLLRSQTASSLSTLPTLQYPTF